jgi:ergothioneine biosynthesis protein EgtB
VTDEETMSASSLADARRTLNERPADLSRAYVETRALSLALSQPLSPEDMTVQSMADASPTKWHLAHTTWFFETFVLCPFGRDYRVFDGTFGFLFNSYYEALGARHPRPERGLLTRPTVDEVLCYRRHVDEAIGMLLVEGGQNAETGETMEALITLGIHHEQQHQELILTDIAHAFSRNPLRPAYRPAPVPSTAAAPPVAWIERPGGLVEIGHGGKDFAFDNEGPRHRVFLAPYRLASRPVSNGEWIRFIADGGYRRPELWLSDGWARAMAEGWLAPLYWEEDDEGCFRTFGLRGMGPVEEAAPVCHISFYEADAFARWAGKRLPTEAEWEDAAHSLEPLGNTLGSGHLAPRPGTPTPGLHQMFGDVWEWTGSAYQPYPGFRPAAGAVGEYNGKFMCNQMVLRGGSCVTPDGHVRATYRNFFYPHQRWQFSGVRLVEGGA